MRLAALFLSLSLFAGQPLRVTAHAATLTAGSGREPVGAMPPSIFRVEVSVAGGPASLRPEFRAWSVRNRGRGPRRGRLEAKATPLPEGRWQVSGVWPGSHQDGDRLRVEVWQGRRRLGWVLTALQELNRPESAPRPDRSGN